MRGEPGALNRTEGLDRRKGRSVESLGIVAEEAVCGPMFQGLFLEGPNWQPDGGVERGRGGQQIHTVGSHSGVGDSGSSGAEEVMGEQVIGVYTEEAPPVLAGGSGVWASERAMETDPQASG